MGPIRLLVIAPDGHVERLLKDAFNPSRLTVVSEQSEPTFPETILRETPEIVIVEYETEKIDVTTAKVARPRESLQSAENLPLGMQGLWN